MLHDDLALIEAHLAHDPKAFEQLLTRHSTAIYNFVYRLCGNKDEAYDITQDVFIKVWKNLKKYDTKQKFTTWLYSIARYTTIDWLRKRKNIVFSQLSDNDNSTETFSDTLVDTEPLAHEIFEAQEISETLQQGLSRISFDQRTIITLHHINELTFKEIADILQKSINTVQSHYRRGIIALRKNIDIQNLPK